MKSLKGFVLVLCLMALPAVVFGDSSNPLDSLGSFTIAGTTYYPSFNPLPTDLSVSYLGQIFGTVGTVLHGTSGQILGQIFKVFNIGMLVIAGIFLIYTIIMTVLNTAHEGEFMGRKWNSAWIAVRTVLGLGLLVPSATTGYSTVQVIVMWVVIQGVGFANLAWYSALNYIRVGGQVYTAPSTDISSMINLAGTILEMQVCMYNAQNVTSNLEKNEQAAQKQLQAQGQTPYSAAPSLTQKYIQNFQPLFTNYTNQADQKTYSIVKFPGNPYTSEGSQDNACGQINFGTIDSDKTNILKAAVQQMMLDTDSYAQDIVNPSAGGGPNPNFPNQVQGSIVGAAADFINITLPIRANAQNIINSMTAGYINDVIEQGWIMAGKYYYDLGNIQQKVQAATSVKVTIDAVPGGFDNSANDGSPISFTNKPKIDPSFKNGTPKIKTTGQSQPGLNYFSSSDMNFLVNTETTGATYVVAALNIAKVVDKGNATFSLDIGNAGILDFLLGPIGDFLNQIVNDFNSATGDPILLLQFIGHGMLYLAATLWLVGTVGIFGLGTATSVLSSVQPVGYGVEDALLAFIPTFTVFILTFFVLGATFAFYVPLIPFIIFVFSAVGWLIAVIEAMVAAPLVAFGITHPEGHDLLGKSEQAIMLLLSVFLRPVLMVIGLIAGMILSKVVLRFLNSGFFGIVFSVGDFNLFAFIAVLVVYCMLLVTIVNQAFSLIYVIPDRVMRWIGLSEQTTTVQEALQSSKAGFEQSIGGTQRLGEGITGAIPGWRDRVKKRSDDYNSANKDKKNLSASGQD